VLIVCTFFFEKVNDSGQNFLDVLWDCEDDFQVADECFMVLLKNYDFDNSGMIIGQEIKQIIRGSPIQFDLVRDPIGRFGYDENGEKLLVCPLHRDLVYEGESKTHCPVCKTPTRLYPAHFRERMFYGASGSQDNEINYYIEGEVLYSNKYNPNRFRGLSQLVSVQAKVESLIAMDIYVRDYYSMQRPPKGLLLINTTNTDELTKAWEKMLKMTRGNPNIIQPWAVQSPSTGGTQVAQWIDFMNKMSENEYVPTRQEFRTVIGAQFGVMPLFQGDMSQAAGLNNEGLEITVTNRAVEVGQGIWNNKLFPRLMKEFGVIEFDLILNPSEEQDEAADVDLDIKKSQHAQIMQSMGFEVSVKPDKKLEFKFSEEPVAPAMGSPGAGGFGEGSLGFGSGGQDAGAGAIPTLDSVGDQRFGGEPSSVRLGKARSPIVLGRSMKQRLLEQYKAVFKRFNYKRKPTEKRLRELTLELTHDVNKSLRRAMDKELKKVYRAAQLGVGKELGIKIGFGKIDENALEVIKSQRIFEGAFKNFESGVRESIEKAIKESFEEPSSVSELVEKLSESVDVKQSDLVRIARTESHHVSTIARSNSYFKADPGGKFKFKWIGPSDHRETDICKEIKARSIKGLKKSDLKKLVHDVAKANGHKPRDWTPHINCRHTLVRTIGSINKMSSHNNKYEEDRSDDNLSDLQETLLQTGLQTSHEDLFEEMQVQATETSLEQRANKGNIRDNETKSVETSRENSHRANERKIKSVHAGSIQDRGKRSFQNNKGSQRVDAKTLKTDSSKLQKESVQVLSKRMRDLQDDKGSSSSPHSSARIPGKNGNWEGRSSSEKRDDNLSKLSRSKTSKLGKEVEKKG